MTTHLDVNTVVVFTSFNLPIRQRPVKKNLKGIFKVLQWRRVNSCPLRSISSHPQTCLPLSSDATLQTASPSVLGCTLHVLPCVWKAPAFSELVCENLSKVSIELVRPKQYSSPGAGGPSRQTVTLHTGIKTPVDTITPVVIVWPQPRTQCIGSARFSRSIKQPEGRLCALHAVSPPFTQSRHFSFL